MDPVPTLFEVIYVSAIIGALISASLILINKVHLFILRKFFKKD
jgi:hypothetical protein